MTQLASVRWHHWQSNINSCESSVACTLTEIQRKIILKFSTRCFALAFAFSTLVELAAALPHWAADTAHSWHSAPNPPAASVGPLLGGEEEWVRGVGLGLEWAFGMNQLIDCDSDSATAVVLCCDTCSLPWNSFIHLFIIIIG